MAIRFFKTKRKIKSPNEIKDMYLATIETGEVVDIDEISEIVEKENERLHKVNQRRC